jgi:hypothetical protein
MERRGETLDAFIFLKITGANTREMATRQRNRRHRIGSSRRADRRHIERSLILKIISPVVERYEGLQWENG